MSEENVEVVRRTFEEFQAGVARGDPGAAWDAGLVATDSEFITPEPFEGKSVWRGREEYVEFMKPWVTEEFKGMSFRLERLIDAGDDRVVALIHMSGTGADSGVPVEFKPGAIYQLRDGRVIRMWTFLSHADALEAAGLSE